MLCNLWTTIEPGDLPYQVLTQMYQLHDAQNGLKSPMPTCYEPQNTYKEADGEINPRAKTIDYILFKSFLPYQVIFKVVCF